MENNEKDILEEIQIPEPEEVEIDILEDIQKSGLLDEPEEQTDLYDGLILEEEYVDAEPPKRPGHIWFPIMAVILLLAGTAYIAWKYWSIIK